MSKDLKAKEKGINTSVDFLRDLNVTLERVIILLEDNPKIKDTAEFYTGSDVLWEVADFHREISEVLK